jgi:hypothetical protein
MLRSAGITSWSQTEWPSSCRARNWDASPLCLGSPRSIQCSLPTAARPQRAADRRAHALGPGLENAGQGMKIAIIDEGSTSGIRSSRRPGTRCPLGSRKARPPTRRRRSSLRARSRPPDRRGRTRRSFDRGVIPRHSRRRDCRGECQHLAEGTRISGVAPRAYLGNYKALTIPTDADVGLDGNSPELAAAIEAAVADGMDVINMSLGEPRSSRPATSWCRHWPQRLRRRGLRRRGGQRLQRLRARVDRTARLVAGRDHGRRGLDVSQRPRGRCRLVLLERADTARYASSRK